MLFSTAGSMGDSIYHTLFMLEAQEALNEAILANRQLEARDSLSIHLQTNKKCSYYKEHPYGTVGLTTAAADFLAPLFEKQGWPTTVGDEIPYGAFDIDNFRKLRLNFSCGEIRLWCYNLSAVPLPMNLQRKTLTKYEPDSSFAEKVIVCRTDRYINAYIDYKLLEPIKDRIVFVGLEKEHKSFCDEIFPVDYYKCKDAVDMLNVMAGAKAVISNPCGPYALAEQAKLPRCLLTPEFLVIQEKYIGIGPVNVIPQGGACWMCGTNSRLQEYVKQIGD